MARYSFPLSVPLISMLSSTAPPSKPGGGDGGGFGVSVPSSKIIEMLSTTVVERIGGTAAASAAAFQRRRSHPAIAGEKIELGGGELQPTKWITPAVSFTLKRGAPAPQCEPMRMSYPSSVSVMPFTPVMNASADAMFG